MNITRAELLRCDEQNSGLRNRERTYKRIMGSILLASFDKFKCRENNGREMFEQL